ncbi:MAG: hypothetical protein MI743_21170 [Sneathiellales bacterium]|nr:hypothetical protein [Sneathiellales bacterium]
MTDLSSIVPSKKMSLIPDMPMVAWMVLLTITLGLAGGLSAEELISSFNAGFGRALGEFALILLPSFALAASLSRQHASAVKGLATVTSPIAGAGMICPDTAYAALSPIAGRQKLAVAFGSYAGFKLLFPAGPLLIATALGVADPLIPFYGFMLLMPVWGAGILWAKMTTKSKAPSSSDPSGQWSLQSLRPLYPFFLLAALLVIGFSFDFSSAPLIEFFTLPKGALLIAACLSLLDCPRENRRSCLDSSVRRTGSLLLIIGAATAFGTILNILIPMGNLVPSSAGLIGLISLFILTMLFKLVQGSSMATFAAVAPVAAPIVISAGLPPVAAVFVICLGSFIAILPNDSFYWLVRRDALEDVKSERRAIWILSGGAVAQALTGLLIVLITTWIYLL